MKTTSDWPFEEPKNLAVFTVRSIVEKRKQILYVSHDKQDGAWQFHDGGDPKEEDAMIVALDEIVDIDESVRQLADLPCGWIAVRDTRSKPWKRYVKKYH